MRKRRKPDAQAKSVRIQVSLSPTFAKTLDEIRESLGLTRSGAVEYFFRKGFETSEFMHAMVSMRAAVQEATDLGNVVMVQQDPRKKSVGG